MLLFKISTKASFHFIFLEIYIFIFIIDFTWLGKQILDVQT